MTKQYENYKSSGIEWIGDIPEHWEVKKLKFLGKALIGITYNPSELTDKENGILVLRSSNVQNGKIDYKDCVYVNKKVQDKQITREFDILICSRNGSIDLIGKNALIDENSSGVTFGAFMTIFRSNSYAYLYFFLNSLVFKLQSGDFFTSTINQLTTGILNQILVPIPKSISEQQQIASYLDEKTVEIDQFIKNKEGLINLLEEEKKAVITQAVTKGLDKNVKFKSSGVDWLGDIPEHWEVRKLKRICQIKRGASPRPIASPKYFDDNGEFGWVRISDVTKSDRYLERTTQYLSKLGTQFSVKMYPNDIFLSIAGSVGKAIITKVKCCIHDGFVWFSGLKIDNEFLYYIFQIDKIYEGLGKEGTQLNLNTETIGSIIIPVIDILEQKKIVAYLDNEIQKIDDLKAKYRQEIDLIKEYKERLIYDVVTGKINVLDH